MFALFRYATVLCLAETNNTLQSIVSRGSKYIRLLLCFQLSNKVNFIEYIRDNYLAECSRFPFRMYVTFTVLAHLIFIHIMFRVKLTEYI